MAAPDSARAWIEALGLQAHPEGGWYREVYRSPERVAAEGLPERYTGPRSLGTSIYFLMTGDRPTRFHRLRSDETWHFHAGSGAVVHLLIEGAGYARGLVGLDVDAGERPQVQIPRGAWFAATVNDPDGYTLVGCTVQPGFEFEDFELGQRDALLASFPDHRDVILRGT
ncbi:MAG: cupin domain-containing protein [Deltaproteobacteria bacterium]|nr:MAG: cupin domain-containing protein [Deltaproteobacteria bacterium]